MTALHAYAEDDSHVRDELRVDAFSIGALMREQGLPAGFIAEAVDNSKEFDGIFRLMKLWRDESDQNERNAIIADIQELIEDCSQRDGEDAAYIRFDDLERIAENIRSFKDNLRALVDERGGITRLAQLTDIPQPSLSRFFNSAAMPRRTTLNKIARALNLSQVEIATEWAV